MLRVAILFALSLSAASWMAYWSWRSSRPSQTPSFQYFLIQVAGALPMLAAALIVAVWGKGCL